MANNSIRTRIGDRLVTIFGEINTSILLPDSVTPKYNTDVKVCKRRLVFIDEVESSGYPAIYVTAASENRVNNPSRTDVKHIMFIVRGYIYDEKDSDARMNDLMEDVETALNSDYYLAQLNGLVTDIRIVEITSDEGLLSPEAVFEMILDATVVVENI